MTIDDEENDDSAKAVIKRTLRNWPQWALKPDTLALVDGSTLCICSPMRREYHVLAQRVTQRQLDRAMTHYRSIGLMAKVGIAR